MKGTGEGWNLENSSKFLPASVLYGAASVFRALRDDQMERPSPSLEQLPASEDGH